jgi:Tol biopolymer transport system component
VFGLNLKTRAITTFRKIAGEYNEVEGIFPDGRSTLVESSRDQVAQNSSYIDIWRMPLVPNATEYVRLTHWGEYDGYKASNPVVSPDGKTIAFQSARSKDAAGVGYGIYLMDVK